MKNNLRKKLLITSLITFIVSVVVFVIAYFFFHYVTDSGITFIKQEEAGKPFVTNLIGQFGVLCFFASALCFISAFVFADKE